MNDIEKVWLKAYCAGLNISRDWAQTCAEVAVEDFKKFRKSMGVDEQTKQLVSNEKAFWDKRLKEQAVRSSNNVWSCLDMDVIEFNGNTYVRDSSYTISDGNVVKEKTNEQ